MLNFFVPDTFFLTMLRYFKKNLEFDQPDDLQIKFLLELKTIRCVAKSEKKTDYLRLNCI